MTPTEKINSLNLDESSNGNSILNNYNPFGSNNWFPSFELNAVPEFDSDKLILVLGITFGFILLLLLSILCIFYTMGVLQNVFGYSWGRPMGRTISMPYFYPAAPSPDGIIPTANHIEANHVIQNDVRRFVPICHPPYPVGMVLNHC